jgi:hypothetical protein
MRPGIHAEFYITEGVDGPYVHERAETLAWHADGPAVWVHTHASDVRCPVVGCTTYQLAAAR